MIFPAISKFNFDSALRYKVVVDLIEESEQRTSPILEVGPGGSGISDYFKGPVIGIDTNFSKTETAKNSNIRYIKGSIFKIPVKDNSYDNVVCLDTLEHIAPVKRFKAISELVRVTKIGGVLYLGFPSGEKSLLFEKKINKLYRSKYKKEHIWLKEHEKNGLPEKEKIISDLNNLGIRKEKIKVIGNVNLFIWFLMHWLFTVYPRQIISRILKRFYLLLFYMFYLPVPPFYRVILIIKK